MTTHPLTIEPAAAHPRRPTRPVGGGHTARAAWVPRQHGAWGMLVSPVIAGMVLGGVHLAQLPLVALWLVGYLWFHATTLWLKARRRPACRRPVVVYGLVTVLAAAGTLLTHPGSARWLPLFALPLAVAGWEAWRGRDRSVASGISTSLVAALFTVVVVDAGGVVDSRTWALVVIQAFYLVGVLLHVRSMIRGRRDQRVRLASIVLHLVAMVAALWWSPWLALVAAVALGRTLLIPRLGWKPRRIGLAEIPLHALVLAVALLVV